MNVWQRHYFIILLFFSFYCHGVDAEPQAEPYAPPTISISNLDQALLWMKGATIYGIALLLQHPDGHDFTGQSFSEEASTGLGIAGGSVTAEATVRTIEDLQYWQKRLTGSWWLVNAESKLLAVPLLFTISWYAHTPQFNFFKLSKRAAISLYTGNAALGLTYTVIKEIASNKRPNLSEHARETFSATFTALGGLGIIVTLAVGKQIDIKASDFNSYRVLLTALAVGQTVAMSGRAINSSARWLLASVDIPDEKAEVMAQGATIVSFVALLNIIKGVTGPGPYINYRNKVIGDLGKSTGLMMSLYWTRPVLQNIHGSVHDFLASLPMARIAHAAADPAMMLGTHALITAGLARFGAWNRPAIYDLSIGYMLGAGLGMAEDYGNVFTRRTWQEHLMVWSLAMVTVFWKLRSQYISQGKVKAE